MSDPAVGPATGVRTVWGRLGRIPQADVMGLDGRYTSWLAVQHRHVLKVYDALGVLSALSAGVFGLTMGWLVCQSALTGAVVGLAAGLMVVNLHRLGFASAALVPHAREDDIAAWRPSITMGAVTAALGGLLVQIPAAWLVVALHPEDMEGHRRALIDSYSEGMASGYASRIAHADAELVELSNATGGESEQDPTSSEPEDGTAEAPAVRANAPADRYAGVRLLARTAERDALLVEREAAVTAERSAYGLRIATLPLAGSRVELAWGHPMLMLSLTALGMLCVGGPALLRSARPGTMRAYARERLQHERTQIMAIHDAGEARAVSSLGRWRTFGGRIVHRYEDPPFNSRPLILGRYMGTVVERSDAAALISGIPEFAAAAAALADTDPRIERQEAAVEKAAMAVHGQCAREARWDLVRALLQRHAVGGAGDLRRGAVGDWAFRALQSLHATAAGADVQEEFHRELDASPVSVSLVRGCTHCGAQAEDVDTDCTMCGGDLATHLTLGDRSLRLDGTSTTR